jgi:ABC-type nitrate/sulfonate/bicarbonate transport system permease component
MSMVLTRSERWSARGWRLAIVVAVALVWELSGRLHWVDPELLPPLSSILEMLGRLLQNRDFRSDILVTVSECLAAFLIVAPLGLMTGFLLGESPRLYRTFSPALQLLMTVPKSIFLPVFILLFGIDFSQKVIFAVVLSYFIVVPTGIAAVQSVPPGLVTMAKAFGATTSQIYLRLYLPSAMPLVLSGIRLGLIFSMHGIIFAEMYASSEGIGRSILNWGEAFEMERLFAALLLVLVVTVVLNEGFQALENLARRRSAAGAPS